MMKYLDARNPVLKCLCMSATPAALPWSERVCVRSPFRRPDDATQPQDMIFFAQWTPNFVVSVCCQGGLLIRMAFMHQCLADVELCVTNLKRRCLCKGDLASTNRSWSQPMVDWMAWAAGQKKMNGGGGGCEEQDSGPRAPWERIFPFAHHRSPTRSTAVVFDELTPLWYLLLKIYGYVTGAPHPYLAPWTVDTSCLPRLQLMNPARVGPLTTSLAVQLTTSVNLSPVMFTNMIMGLAELCRYKMNALRACLSRQCPAVAELYKAGFQKPLVKAAQLWCRKAMQAKHDEVASILATDLPCLIYAS